MALVLVTHDTAAPALYGALAAIVAADRGAPLAHLPAAFDTGRHPDAVQHVAASGVLVPSGLLWFERLAGRDVLAATTVEAVLGEAARRDVVVPLHPAVMPAGLVAALREAAGTAGGAVERVTVRDEGARFALHRSEAGRSTERPDRWRRDDFGRFVRAEARTGIAGHRATARRVALIGAERDHREVYPGALAALGDAADQAGIALDVAFIDPRGLRAGEVGALLAGIDGVLLPGGSDMGNVPGQILIARAAFDAAVPTVGLCLGMQTMATALAQSVLGGTAVDLAEAAPDAPLHSFIPMAEGSASLSHRLGERATFPVPGTRYGALSGGRRAERFNHRYRLNIALEHALATAGCRISAWDETGTIADAIEADRHPFFIGLQGHPELRSRPGSPHPVLLAFVLALRPAVDRGPPRVPA